MAAEAKQSILELRQELIRLKSDLLNATDPADMQRLAQAAGQVQDQLVDVNEQVRAFAAGGDFEKAAGQLGEVRSALANLDFEKAAARARSLSTTVNGISFASATKGLKDLGTTFVQLGKSLLTNPLFLLASVIVAIGFAIYEMLKQAGVMKVIMEQVGKVMEFVQIGIDAVIQALKDLADWFGITNNAAEDYAEKQAKAAKKAADEQESYGNDVIQNLNNQIRSIKASGDESDAAFEKILAAERAKRVELNRTANARVVEAKQALDSAILKGELNEQEIQELRDKYTELTKLARQSSVEINLGDQEAAQQRRDRQAKQDAEEEANEKKRLERAKQYAQDRLNAERQIEDIRISLIADDTERELAENNAKYARLIEDTKKNETLLQKEREALIKGFEDQQKQQEEKIKADQEKKDQDVKDSLMALLQAQNLARQDALTQELANLEAKELNEVDTLKKALDQKLVDQEEYEKRKKEIEDYYANLKKEAKDAADITEKEAADKAKKAQEDADADALAKKLEYYNKLASAAQKWVDDVTGFIGNIFAIEEATGDQSEKAQEEREKKKFELTKAAAIGEATIKTALAVATALANPPGPPFSTINAVAAGIFGAAQIAAIAAQPFKGSGGGGRGAAPSMAGAPIPSGPAIPQFGLVPAQSGLPQQSMNQPTATTNMTVKAYVTETDVTDTQKKIDKIKSLSEL